MEKHSVLKIVTLTILLNFIALALDGIVLGDGELNSKGQTLAYQWHPIFGSYGKSLFDNDQMAHILAKRFGMEQYSKDNEHTMTDRLKRDYYLPKNFFLRMSKRDDDLENVDYDGPKLKNFVAAYLTPTFRRNAATEKRNIRGVQRTMILLG